MPGLSPKAEAYLSVLWELTEEADTPDALKVWSKLFLLHPTAWMERGSITLCIAVTEAGSGIDECPPPNSSENA